MAIDKKKPVAFDDVTETEVAAVPAEMEGAPEEASETVTLSTEMLGGQKVSPGDVVKLEVVSVSDEDGTIQVKYAQPKTGGIAKAAAAFNEGM